MDFYRRGTRIANLVFSVVATADILQHRLLTSMGSLEVSRGAVARWPEGGLGRCTRYIQVSFPNHDGIDDTH